MKTSKEKAKEAREQAREIITDRGFNYNEVSVRKRSGSLSSKIKIEIKNEEIKKSWFNHIKLKHEDVSRDEKSREVLGGGNTFFTVTHSRDITSSLQDEVREIIESLEPGQEQMWNGYQIVRNSKGQLFVKREANDFVDTGRRGDETQTVHSLVAEYLK